MGTINGIDASRVQIDMSTVGQWYAMVTIREVSIPKGQKVVIEIGPRSWVGTVTDSVTVNDLCTVSVVGGNDKLHSRISAPLNRSNENGVMLSEILSALGANGETIKVRYGDISLGTHWNVFAGDTIADSLDRLGIDWRVDDDGVIRVGPLPTGEPLGDACTVIGTMPGVPAFKLRVDAERLNEVVCGKTFDAEFLDKPVEIEDLRIEDSSDYVIATVNLSASTNARARFADHLRRHARLSHVYPYLVERVSGVPSGHTVDLRPEIPSDGLPGMLIVPHAGLAGGHGVPKVGQRALVCFEGGSPARPLVLAYGKGIPATLSLDGDSVVLGAEIEPLGGHPAAARKGDTVSCGSLSVTTTLAAPTVLTVLRFDPYGVPIPPPIPIALGVDATVVIPLDGAIMGGSTKVRIQ